MADILRSADAVWSGEIKSGNGSISTTSGVLKEAAYSFGTRFENADGTNPEELVAAAHAACYSMALAATLGRGGHKPEQIKTHATVTLESLQAGGFKVAKVRLETTGTVPGMDDATFKQIAAEAEKTCPISNLVRGGAEIELDAKLAPAGKAVSSKQ